MFRTVLLGCGIAASLLAVGALARLARRVPVLAATPLSAQALSDNASEAAPYDAIDTYLGQQLDRLNVPGATLAIVEGDQIVHLRGFGRARPGGPPPSPQTPFVLGSITKSFTALAAMQLVGAGKVELDAPVRRYLPWFRVADPQASAQMTVRQLLIQTSGLPVGPGWEASADFDQSPDAAERQARELAALRLRRPVGTAFEYSNANYDLLGLIVEAASGEGYAEYVQRHIFRPLAMRHSYTTRGDAVHNGLAVGHRYWFGCPIVAPDLPLPRGSLAAGYLIASAEDLAHYLIAHVNDGRYGDAQILSPAGIAELHRPAVEAKMSGVSMGHYGMSWFVDDRGPTQIAWHEGIVPEFYAYVAILPGQRKGLVLLVNADHFAMNLALTEVGRGAAALLAGARPDPARLGAILPWALHALLLIPALQLAEVAGTLRRVHRWRRDPTTRPSSRRMWALHVLLPLVPNLLVALGPLGIVASGMPRFLLLFGPDFSWLALLCGGFAGVWSPVRTGLVLRALRRAPAMQELRQVASFGGG